MDKGIIIVDLDGTLANAEHRMHLLPSEGNRDKTLHWDTFNKAAIGDAPIQDTIDIVNSLYKNYTIVILTGRCDIVKEETILWLNNHNVKYDNLIMRKEGDHRKDTVIKEEVLRGIGLNKILACFDDLPHVVEHIRGLGLTCYHVDSVDDKYASRNKDAGSEA